jgi:hypothetical protein
MYERKTTDVWELWTDFHEGTGYELVETHGSEDAAKQVLAHYDEEEPQYTHKLVKRRKT